MKLSDFDFRVFNNEFSKYETNYALVSILILDSLKGMGYLNQEYEIELWIGLYDKNGKKIYENDIVEYQENEALIIKYIKGTFYACQDYEKFMKKYECQDNKDTEKFWLEEAYKINNLRTDDNNFIARFEVIGNIHENHELLKC
ncbi:YopX family protein [Campylobacter jejuni]